MEKDKKIKKKAPHGEELELFVCQIRMSTCLFRVLTAALIR